MLRTAALLRPPAGTELGGVTYLASHIDRLRAEQPNTVVVASGDLIGGSALDSALLHDEPTFDALDIIGLDITSVGNHEFDRPLEELRRLVNGGCHPVDGCADDSRPYDGASFDVLGANVIDRVTGEPAFPAALIREVGGVNIGFIGVTLEGTGSIVYSPFVEGGSQPPSRTPPTSTETWRRGISWPTHSCVQPSAPAGTKVDPGDVSIDGMPLDMSASYRVAMNSFIAEGGSGFESALVGTERTPGRVDIDVVIDHLSAVSPYTPPPLDRVRSR